MPERARSKACACSGGVAALLSSVVAALIVLATAGGQALFGASEDGRLVVWLALAGGGVLFTAWWVWRVGCCKKRARRAKKEPEGEDLTHWPSAR